MEGWEDAAEVREFITVSEESEIGNVRPSLSTFVSTPWVLNQVRIEEGRMRDIGPVNSREPRG